MPRTLSSPLHRKIYSEMLVSAILPIIPRATTRLNLWRKNSFHARYFHDGRAWRAGQRRGWCGAVAGEGEGREAGGVEEPRTEKATE